MIALAVLLGPALAARPDEGGGLFPFDDADIIAYVDGPTGAVRVHYSEDGPSVTILDDDDGDGRPDYPVEVAAVAEDVLAFYADLGFRPPVSESELGLGDLGGSGAFDFYLVDFGNSADGQFSIDACAGSTCTGHMVIENDFEGYGYASISEAVRVLASHELFHAVQAAYTIGQPSWISEGTAVWAEHQYDDSVYDFYGFASAYLDDPGRSIYSPPSGTVTSFSYGTALFFQFLTERFGDGVGPDLQDAFVGVDEDDMIGAVLDVMGDYGGEVEDEWATFARWNLATGRRAGSAESYPFADELRGVIAEVEDDEINDDNRFYPLAATYYTLDHPGGPLAFATSEDPTGLTFSLHATESNSSVLDPVDTWSPEGPGEHTLGDLDEGRYWLVGTYPQLAEQSVKIAFCLGGPDTTAACTDDDDTGDNSNDEELDGKGCSHLPARSGEGLWLLVGLLGLAARRRL
jgi:hypothetical protein